VPKNQQRFESANPLARSQSKTKMAHTPGWLKYHKLKAHEKVKLKELSMHELSVVSNIRNVKLYMYSLHVLCVVHNMFTCCVLIMMW